MRKILMAALIAAAPLCAETYVIQNATIMTVAKGTLKGSIVVKDGKIVEVGEKVMVPSDAKIIDATNQYVIPGIIDCHSHIAADGGINEGSVSVSSMVDIRDVLHEVFPSRTSLFRSKFMISFVPDFTILRLVETSLIDACSEAKRSESCRHVNF